MAPKEKAGAKVEKKPSAKGKPEAEQQPTGPPGPDITVPLKVKFFWIAIVILTVAGIIGCVSQFKKYQLARKVTTPYDEPLENLRKDLIRSLHRRDIEYQSPSGLAATVESLPDLIRAENDSFDARKRKYQDLFHKGLRSASGPWKLHGRNLYYFSKGEKTWYDAETFCISRDAHLTSILDDDEQDFITSQLQHNSWIGLTVKNKEGAWGWSDGSRLRTQYWSDGKPSNGEVWGESSQDCAMMGPSLTSRNWNDENCHNLHDWICKENLDQD